MSEPNPDWQAAVEALVALSDEEYVALVARSAKQFAAAEGTPDPLAAYLVDTRGLPPLRWRRGTAEEVEVLHAQLRAFEERYGAPSDRMLEVAAFRDAEGNLVETEDLMAWSSLYDRYRALTDR